MIRQGEFSVASDWVIRQGEFSVASDWVIRWGEFPVPKVKPILFQNYFRHSIKNFSEGKDDLHLYLIFSFDTEDGVLNC